MTLFLNRLSLFMGHYLDHILSSRFIYNPNFSHIVKVRHHDLDDYSMLNGMHWLYVYPFDHISIFIEGFIVLGLGHLLFLSDWCKISFSPLLFSKWPLFMVEAGPIKIPLLSIMSYWSTVVLKFHLLGVSLRYYLGCLVSDLGDWSLGNGYCSYYEKLDADWNFLQLILFRGNI